MKQHYRYRGHIILIITFLVLSVFRSYSQCQPPRLFDINLTRASSTPVWENCIDNSSDPDQFTLTFISPDNIVNYRLDFGDGSPVVTGALWPANTPVTHTYDLGIYNIVLEETKPSCTKQTTRGKFTNDRKAGATALPPTIGTSGCVPHTLSFVNMSTNTSPFTSFEWNWGDGTRQRVGPETVGKPISHVFARGKAGCNMVVTLTAFSLCDTTFSSYGPYDFWDIDTAAVAASATRICKGQNITFTDQTLYNCNVKQPRKIRWDFRQVGGPLSAWLPATPENRTQTYFVQGNVGDRFTVLLTDSNFCGTRTAAVSVEIIAPPTPQIILANPTICAGQDGVFRNNTSGSADIYYWDFGDGSTVLSTGSKNDVKHTFKNPGTYKVSLIAAISGTDLCRDTADVTINVLPSSISDFDLDKVQGCTPVTVRITEKSQNAVSWYWELGSTTNTSLNRNPGSVTFTDPGTYQIKLETTNSLGCGNSKTATVNVYPSVNVIAEVDSVCLGNAINFKDKSSVLVGSSCATGNILYEKYNNINSAELFRLTTHPSFPDNPSSTALLNSFEPPSNSGENYGARVRGFICPPQTGNYVFWIASDDYSELFLSTDANPGNKVSIASVSGWTNVRQYNKYTSQQSVPIFLQAGQRYYIEALHKEGVSGDHLSVAWQLPNGTMEIPVPGTRLAPYSEGSTIKTWDWNFGNGQTSALQNPAYTYPAAGQYNVQLIVSTGKCSSSVTRPVVVYPTTVSDFVQSDTAACTPFSVDFINKSTGASKLYWDFGDATAGESYNSGQKDTVNHVFINNSGVDQYYYIKLISETASGCRDTSVRRVKVFPGPKADFTFIPSIPKCSPVDVTFRNISATASRYEWYFGNYDSSSTSSKTFNYNFVNKAATVRYDTITLKAYSPSGCYGERQQVITVFPEPDFKIVTLPDSGCNPATINFSLSGGPVTYLWNFGDGSASTVPTPSHAYNNPGNLKDSTYTVTFTGTTAFGCRDTVSKNVKVLASPEADFVASVVAGCSPLTVNFQNISVNAFRSVWNFGDGVIDTIAGNFDHVFTNSDIIPKKYKVTLTVYTSKGCTSSKSVEIIVNPSVNASVSRNVSTGCSPLNVTFRNNSTGGATDFWDFGDGTSSLSHEPSHIFVNSQSKDTTFHIKYMAVSANGCKDSAFTDVVVKAVPAVSFQPDKTSGCTPLSVSFQNLSTKHTHASWTYGDGLKDSTISGFVNHIFTNTGTDEKKFNVTLKVYGVSGCVASKTDIITVYPPVTANFDTDINKGCSPLNVNFTNQSAGEKSLNWEFGDGGFSGSRNPVHSFINTSEKDTTFPVQMVAVSASGCRDTANTTITVSPTPEADFTADVIAGCSPLDVSFSDISRRSVVSVWNFDDNTKDSTTQNTVSHRFVNKGTETKVFSVSLKVYSTGKCISEKKVNIAVYPELKAEFINDVSRGCSPLKVAFTNNSSGAKNYYWNFGNGLTSNSKDPVHTFFNSGENDTTFNVVLQIASQHGCRDSAKVNIVISPTPEADFTTDVTSGCSPLKVELTDNSKRAAILVWEFGDGKKDSSVSRKLKYVFVNNSSDPRTFNVKLKVFSTGRCFAEKILPITVYPAVNADFAADINSGCSPLKVNFSNNSSGAKSYNWDFGDGLAAGTRDVVHTFVNSGTKDTVFNVVLNIASLNNCRDSAETKITVHPSPEADFAADVTRGCSPLKVSFTDLSNKATSSVWTYGDGGRDSLLVKSTEHTFINNGSEPVNYTVSLKVFHGTQCSEEKSQVITVYPSVNADFAVDTDKGCSPLRVSFSNNSSVVKSYNWNFGNGLTSGSRDIIQTFTNQSINDTTFRVVLSITSSSGCTDSSEHTITVLSTPEADFTTDVTRGCSPLKVEITDLSHKSIASAWNFGDGSRDSISNKNLSHVFINNGTEPVVFPVDLKTYSASGCSSRKSDAITVYPAVKAEFVQDVVKGCSPVKVAFTNSSVNAKTYSWNFGDGLTAGTRDVIHTFNHSGSSDTTYKILLTVISANGCADSMASNVRVSPLPEADFSADVTSGCSPLNVAFSDLSAKSIASVWSFGEGTKDSTVVKNFSHTFINNGTEPVNYLVNLKVYSASGCTSNKFTTITVNPAVKAQFVQDVVKGCSPLKVSFINNSVNARTYNWNFGDGLTAASRDVIHTFNNSGNNDTIYKVLLNVISVNGCTDSISSTVKVSPLPEADFFTDVTSGCSPLTVAYSDISSKSIVSVWNFGDGSSDSTTTKDFTHTFVNNGAEQVNIPVSLKVYSASGCTSTKSQIITVNPAVKAQFTQDIVSGCSPLKVSFTNNSVNARTYNWNFGDGLSAGTRDAIHTFTNSGNNDTTYRVLLFVNSANGCTDTLASSVKVSPLPEADFSADVTSGCSPLKVSFSDLSSRNVVSVWNYGDGIKDSTSLKNVDHVFVNDSGEKIRFSIQQKVYSVAGCTAVKNQVVTVFPSVNAAFTMDTSGGCTPVNVKFMNGSDGARTYNWNFGDGLTSASKDADHTFVNSGLKDTVYSVVLYVTSENGCRDSASAPVTVYSAPVSNFAADITSGCTPLNVAITDLSSAAAKSVWNFGDGSVDSSATGTFEHVFENTGTQTRIYNLKQEVYSSRGCKAEKSIPVTVFPGVHAAISAPVVQGCSPLRIVFDNNSTGVSVNTWNFGDGGTASLFRPDHTFLNESSKDTIFNIQYLGISSQGCKDSATINVSVFRNPVSRFVTDLENGCSPLTINFTNISGLADNYFWDFGDGNIDTISDVSHSYRFFNNDLNPKQFAVKLTASTMNGCSVSSTRNIVVYPVVKAEFTTSQTVGCTPVKAEFINKSKGATNYSWNFGNGNVSIDENPLQAFVNSGETDTVYHVKLTATSQYSCNDTAGTDIKVFPAPEASFTTDIKSGCSPLVINFTDLSERADSLVWNFGDGGRTSEKLPMFAHTYVNTSFVPAEYVATLTAITVNGCKDESLVTLNAFPEVSSYFLASDTIGCTPLNVKFTNLSAGGNNFTWTFGDGTDAFTKTAGHSFINSGIKDTTYNVELKVSSGFNCSASYSQKITVHSAPDADFVLGNQTGCSPLLAELQNNSSNASTYSWAFGQGENSDTAALQFSKLFVNNGSGEKVFRVNLTAVTEEGCRDSVYKDVKVYPAVIAEISTTDTAGCSPWRVNFFNLSNATSYNWNFGDGNLSLDASPRHIFNNDSQTKDTVYNVVLIASNSFNCADTLSRKVVVFAKPDAEFFPESVTGCSPASVVFRNNSKGADTLRWDFGDGNKSLSNDSSVSNIYRNEKTGRVLNPEVELLAITRHGCTDRDNQHVNIYPEVKAAFESDPSGCSPFSVKLTNKSEGGNSYEWKFGDGEDTDEPNPFHTYRNLSVKDTVFSIELIARSSFGCADTLTEMVTVFSRPKSLFSVSPGVVQLPDSTVYILNQSSAGDWTYNWDFGDKKVSNEKDPVLHNYDFYGTYRIRLIVNGSNCSDTSYQTVRVLPTKPVASFSGTGSGCTPVTIQFKNNSKYAESYLWDFGDGETSTLKNPGHTYDIPGTYVVTLKVTGEGGTDEVSSTDPIVVHAIPSAFFKVKPVDKVVKIPGNAHYFENLSKGAVTYLWNFGDGVTSTDKNPSHQYSQVGTYDVTLIATNEMGCTNEFKEFSAAIAEPAGQIKFPNAFTPSEGGNLASANKNDFYKPVTEGVSEFQMQIFNRWGELIYEAYQIEPGWDGTYRGKPCKQDVYVCKYKVRFVTGEVQEKVIDVTLIR